MFPPKDVNLSRQRFVKLEVDTCVKNWYKGESILGSSKTNRVSNTGSSPICLSENSVFSPISVT